MFQSKNKRKHVYPCKPQFYYIKVGCKGVYITRTCLHDAKLSLLSFKNNIISPPPFYYMYKARICVVLQKFSNNDNIFGNRTTLFLRNFNPRLPTALTIPMDHIWCDSGILGSRKRDRIVTFIQGLRCVQLESDFNLWRQEFFKHEYSPDGE